MYSLPSLSVSANYAANFQPVKKVEGFSDVKSDIAAEYLMQLPEKQFIAEMALAKQALAEKGANIRKEMEIEYYDRTREDANKRAKFNALSSLGDIGSAIDLSSLGLGRTVDPMSEAVAREQQAKNLQDITRGRMSQITESTKGAIEGLGGMPQRKDYHTRPEIQLPSFGSYAPPAAPELGDQLTRQLGSMEAFHKMWSQPGAKK